MTGEGIEQKPVRRRIDQSAFVVLAVNFDEFPADLAQYLHAHRLIVDEGAGSPVGELRTPQDHLAPAVEAIRRKHAAREVILGDVEGCGHLAVLRSFPHERSIAARAEGK